MENSYGIGVQNRYDMFIDDDADPFDMIQQKPAVQKGSEEKENKKTKSSNKKTVKPDVSAKTEKPNGVAKPPQTQSRNTENRVKFSDREERNNRRNRQDGPRENGTVGQRFDGEERPRRRFENNKRFDDDGAPRRFNNEGGAPRRFDGESRGGRGRGMGRGRGGRGGRRDFDRHSGSERSGVKSVDKREGGGAYNWGSAKDQMDETAQITEQVQQTDLDASDDKEKTASGAEDNAAASGEDSGAENAAPKEPEEPKEMTLDEYKALQNAKRAKPEFNVRKAGEGENKAQWKKTYVLKKKEESDEEATESEEEVEDDSHNKRKNVLLNIDFQFNDSPMRGGRGRGRGGRGGMGGRGRGEGRGGRGGGSFNRGGRAVRQEAPKMDDDRDFPTLSGRK